MEYLSIPERRLHDREYQLHWYKHASQFVKGKWVLDAGAGSGYGLMVFREAGAAFAAGFDPLPLSEDVQQGIIEAYDNASFDIVTAMDVIEHIEDDVSFLRNLLRVARECVFLSTPNWNVSKACNPFHAREYTPLELAALLQTHASGWTPTLWVSDAALAIERRDRFDPEEPWNNFGVLLSKVC